MTATTFPDIFSDTNAKVQIWYWKQRFSMEALSMHNNLFLEAVRKNNDLTKTHVHLGNIDASDPEDAYAKMQGEFWSPNGEAYNFISQKGVGHTTMSLGDVVVMPDGKRLMVASIGFVEI